TLHALLSVVFAWQAARALDVEPSRSGMTRLSVLAALLPMARYEGLFLILVVCVLFLVRRRWTEGLLSGAAALLSLLAYWAVSVLSGGFWLPNSVIIKGAKGGSNPNLDAYRLALTKCLHLLSTPQVLVFVMGVAGLFAVAYNRRQRVPDRARNLAW